jgi:hypothetical protein
LRADAPQSKIDEDGMYLDFFQERCVANPSDPHDDSVVPLWDDILMRCRIRIEEGYVSSLTRLYDKTVAVDSLHDK